MLRVLLLILSFLKLSTSSAQDFVLLSEREQARWIDSMLEYRFEHILPKIMKEHEIDMWVLISREYNEDPVLKTMLPSEWLSARRRTIMVFTLMNDGSVERMAIARYDVGRLLKAAWDMNVYPDQWDALREHIQQRNPQNIAINFSQNFGLSDGISMTDYELLLLNLPSEWHNKIISAEPLAIAWLETRSPMELALYPEICMMGHQILDEVFSSRYIVPGVTATEDLVWALRQQVKKLGLETWFHPSVSLQRADDEKFNHLRTFSKRPDKQIIEYGDLLHVDFGITYLRMNTDQQQHYYVLKPGESDAPEGIKKALATANRLQDILTSQFEIGISGNELLRKSIEKAKAEGIDGSIYSHPIGFHGHAAGPTIGLWDNQVLVKGTGDYTIKPQTAYSIELNAVSFIPEWNKYIRIMLEEEALFDGIKVTYPAGRQTNIYLVKIGESN